MSWCPDPVVCAVLPMLATSPSLPRPLPNKCWAIHHRIGRRLGFAMLFYCASSGKSPDQIPPRPPNLRTMRRYSRSSDRRFRCIQLPWVFDALRGFLKFKDSLVSPYVGKNEIFNRSPLRDGLSTSIWHFRTARARLGLTHREIRDCEAFAPSSKCFAALLTSPWTTHRCREKQAGQDWAAETNVRIGRRCMRHFQPTRG